MRLFFFSVIILHFFAEKCVRAQCLSDLSSGSYHTLAVKTDGSLWAWGRNDAGMLGTGSSTEYDSIAARVGSSDDWMLVAAGRAHSLAIKKNGTMWSWGANAVGQLGLGHGMPQYKPSQVGNDTTWHFVAAGGMQSFAIRADGTLWRWGLSITGATASPTQVGSEGGWKIVSVGEQHVLAIKDDGTLWGWGANDFGQVGDGTTTSRTLPVQIGNDNDWQSLECGPNLSFGIKKDGSLWSWGDNSSGQLGHGTTSSSLFPLRVQGANDWKAVSAGQHCVIGLTSDGKLFSWGAVLTSGLGTGDTSSALTPKMREPGRVFSHISAGERFSIAIGPSLGISTGENGWGQLGNGDSNNKTTFVAILYPPCNFITDAEGYSLLSSKPNIHVRDGHLLIETHLSGDDVIALFDLLGRELISVAGQRSVPLHTLPAEVYVARLYIDGKVYTYKIANW